MTNKFLVHTKVVKLLSKKSQQKNKMKIPGSEPREASRDEEAGVSSNHEEKGYQVRRNIASETSNMHKTSHIMEALQLLCQRKSSWQGCWVGLGRGEEGG